MNKYQVPVSFTPIHGATANGCWENPPKGVFRRGCIYSGDTRVLYLSEYDLNKQVGYPGIHPRSYLGICDTRPSTTETTRVGIRVPQRVLGYILYLPANDQNNWAWYPGTSGLTRVYNVPTRVRPK